MSFSEGLERLTNWQRASSNGLVLLSVTLKGDTPMFESRVRVLAVDGSTLILSNVDSPNENRTIYIRDAAFSCSDVFGHDLELTLVNGNKLYLLEED